MGRGMAPHIGLGSAFRMLQPKGGRENTGGYSVDRTSTHGAESRSEIAVTNELGGLRQKFRHSCPDPLLIGFKCLGAVSRFYHVILK